MIGSLPPQGRDLDLAVSRCDLDSLASTLIAAGFFQSSRQYVRFGEGKAQVVEISALEDWGLPDAQIEAMIDQARTLDGLQRFARPAPAHVLLLLAAHCARYGKLTAGRWARMQLAVQEEPHAWETAFGHASDWHAGKALQALHRYAKGKPPSLAVRIDALAQPRSATGTSLIRARIGAARRIAARSRRGAVVALSGVDGAGKSSQAAALSTALECLGEDPVVVWSRVRYDPLLATIGALTKKLMAPTGAVRSGTVSLHQPPETALETAPQSRRRRAEEATWAYISAAVDGYRHLRLCAPAVLRGKIVICDR